MCHQKITKKEKFNPMKIKNAILTIILAYGLNTIMGQDYFPMIKGSYWIYNVYQEGKFSYTDSTVYQQDETIHDTLFHEFVHYYIENNIISQKDTFFLYDNSQNSNTIMLSNRNIDVIDSAVYAMHMYTDGEWWIAKKIPANDTIEVESIGNFTVPAGTFNNCFRQGGEYIFAPGTGIIRINLWNEISYQELVRYQLPKNSEVNKKSISTIHIYPNPAHSYIRIDGIPDASYEIISISGQLVKAGTLNTTDISIVDFKPGLYLLKIQKDDSEYLKKIIIQ